jgi:hypothetical protein
LSSRLICGNKKAIGRSVDDLDAGERCCIAPNDEPPPRITAPFRRRGVDRTTMTAAVSSKHDDGGGMSKLGKRLDAAKSAAYDNATARRKPPLRSQERYRSLHLRPCLADRMVTAVAWRQSDQPRTKSTAQPRTARRRWLPGRCSRRPREGNNMLPTIMECLERAQHCKQYAARTADKRTVNSSVGRRRSGRSWRRKKSWKSGPMRGLLSRCGLCGEIRVAGL